MFYKNIKQINLNTWTTVSALNLHNFTAIKKFVIDNKLDHSYAFLHCPDELNVKYHNDFTAPYVSLFPGKVAIDRNNQKELDVFLQTQKELRGL
jgi:hypothetical protein